MKNSRFNAVILLSFMAFSVSMPAARSKPIPTPTPTPAPVAGPTMVKACATSGVQGAQACGGDFAGYLNGGSGGRIADLQFALAEPGHIWDNYPETVEDIERFSGSSVDFSTLFRGLGLVSIRYGAGQGPATVGGGTTGSDRIDGLAGLNTPATSFGSLSNVVRSKPNVGGAGGGGGGADGGGGGTDAVPEPAIWMQFIFGFGLMGAISRYRAVAVANQTKQIL